MHVISFCFLQHAYIRLFSRCTRQSRSPFCIPFHVTLLGPTSAREHARCKMQSYAGVGDTFLYLYTFLHFVTYLRAYSILCKYRLHRAVSIGVIAHSLFTSARLKNYVHNASLNIELFSNQLIPDYDIHIFASFLVSARFEGGSTRFSHGRPAIILFTQHSCLD